jgi:hypothetical protein
MQERHHFFTHSSHPCEGSAASATSKETEIKLVNVAKASLQELLVDYQEYLVSKETTICGRIIQ